MGSSLTDVPAMIRSLCLLVALACLSYGSSLEQWQEYKVKFEKEYSGEEEEQRYSLWLKNKKFVDDHNLADKGYSMSLNEFSDWTEDEKNSRLTGYTPLETSPVERISFKGVESPTSLDHRDNGLVTDIKNQGHCGSCWAFSATGGIEGVWALKTGELIPVSEQQMLDCGQGSCDGGHMFYGWETAKNGINSEEAYPYEAEDGTCRFDSNAIVSSVTGSKQVYPDEEDIMNALYEVGYPISIGIHAGDSFKQYSGGIYSDPSCVNGRLNHAILIVGYNRDVAGEEYWIVRNSWGSNWGEGGYIKMKMGENSCGLAYDPWYPTLDI